MSSLPKQESEFFCRTVTERADLLHDHSVPLYAYWNSLASVEQIPGFEEFDVLRLPAGLWPSIIVTQSIEGGRDFLYRVVGSEVDANNGYFIRGKRLSELNIDPEGLLLNEFQSTLADRRPRVSAGRFLVGDWNFKRVSRLLCPLANEDGEPSFVVGTVFFHPLSERFRRSRAD